MKYLLRLLFLGAFALRAVAEPHSVPLTPAERADLLGRLDEVRARHPSVESNFSEQRGSRLLKKPVMSTGTIAFQTPNKFRREVGGNNPSLTVSNGRQLWIFYPNFNSVEEYTLGQRAAFDDAMAAITAGLNFGNVEAFYAVDAARQDNGWRVTLTPKKGNIKRVMSRLDIVLDGDLNVRRTDLTLPKGDHVVTSYTNPRRTNLPPGTFEFAPPAGAQVTRPLGK